MTARQRLHAILNRQPFDRLSWTTLVDDLSRSPMPRDIRRLHVWDFYRHIGCDIVQFGNYGLPPEDRVPQPARLVMPDVESRWERDGSMARHVRRSPWGDLVMEFEGGHPTRYPVDSPETMRTLRAICEHSRCEPNPAHPERFHAAEAKIGDDGMYLPTLDPSPVQHLLEYEMGMEHFYFLLQDHPAEFRALLDAMHNLRMQEYRITARTTPAEAVIPVENTSSTMLSPALYDELSLPQVRDYVDVLHAGGKKAILHMCGHLKALLDGIGRTGLDATNATTPPTVGTTYVEDVLDAFGEDFVIFGGVADASVVQKHGVTEAEIRDYLDALYTPRIRQTWCCGSSPTASPHR